MANPQGPFATLADSFCYCSDFQCGVLRSYDQYCAILFALYPDIPNRESLLYNLTRSRMYCYKSRNCLHGYCLLYFGYRVQPYSMAV